MFLVCARAAKHHTADLPAIDHGVTGPRQVLLVSACLVAALLKWQRYTRSMMATDFMEQLKAMKDRGEVDDEQALTGGVRDAVARQPPLLRTWLSTRCATATNTAQTHTWVVHVLGNPRAAPLPQTLLKLTREVCMCRLLLATLGPARAEAHVARVHRRAGQGRVRRGLERLAQRR